MNMFWHVTVQEVSLIFTSKIPLLSRTPLALRQQKPSQFVQMDSECLKVFVSLHKPIVYLNDERLSWPSNTSAIDGSQILLFSEGFEERVEIVLARKKVKVFVVNHHQVVVSVPPNFRNRMC